MVSDLMCILNGFNTVINMYKNLMETYCKKDVSCYKIPKLVVLLGAK